MEISSSESSATAPLSKTIANFSVIQALMFRLIEDFDGGRQLEEN